MRLVILGAGGYGQTVGDIACQSGCYERIIFLDDALGCTAAAGKCGDYLRFAGDEVQMYPAFGSSEIRMGWLEKLYTAGIPVPTLVHSAAYVSPTAELGVGTVVLPGAAVGTGVKLGRGCIINMNAVVDHGCVIGDGVHICPGAVVKAENRIPSGQKIESGSVIQARTLPV